MSTSNALFTLVAYKKGPTWYFDDKSRDIKKEPFVLGASELIDLLAQKAGKSKARKITVAFSEDNIPNADCHLVCTQKNHPYKFTGKYKTIKGKKIPITIEDTSLEPISGWYIDNDGNKCWLCPAQMKFFGKVADQIFVKIL